MVEKAENDKPLERFVSNSVTVFVARLVMPVIISAFLALVAAILNRQADTLDKHTSSFEEVKSAVASTNAHVRSLESQMTIRAQSRDREISDINRQIYDHEGRIRVLERPVAMPR